MTQGSPRTDGAHAGRDARARRRARAALVVAVVVASTLSWLVVVHPSWLVGVDEDVHALTRGWADRLGWPVDVARVVGRAFSPLPSTIVGVIAFVALMLAGRRAAALLVALSGLAGAVVSQVVKLSVGRQRPPGAEAYQQDMFKSFPSGHAMTGIYLVLLLGLVLVHLGRADGRPWLARLGWGLVALGPCIGMTRPMLGVHWASDVLAGWAFGSVVALGSALLLWRALDLGWRSPVVVTVAGSDALRPAGATGSTAA